MVADKRVLNGLEAEEMEKMFILPNGAVVGAAGGKFLMDDFLPQVKKVNAKDFDDLISKAEDIVRRLYKRYRPRFGYDWPSFGVLVMGLDKLSSGAPRIRLIEERGVSEEVESFQIVGHGAAYAQPFVRLIHEPEMTTVAMARGAFFAISMIESLELDESVGGLPDVIAIENGKAPKNVEFWQMAKTGLDNLIQSKEVNWIWLMKWLTQKAALDTFRTQKVFERFSSEEEDWDAETRRLAREIIDIRDAERVMLEQQEEDYWKEAEKDIKAKTDGSPSQ